MAAGCQGDPWWVMHLGRIKPDTRATLGGGDRAGAVGSTLGPPDTCRTRER